MNAITPLRFVLATVVAFLVGVAAAPGQGTLIGITNSVWSYSADNTDQYALGFPNADTSGWPTGRGLFGNDVSGGYPYPFATPVQSSALGIQTAYFQTTFAWNGATAGVTFILTNYVDDGVVLYLNGVELIRWNLQVPGGTPVSHATLAAGANPGGEPVRVVHRAVLDALTNGHANPLRTGLNVLAASVHQSGTASSDAVFGLSLSVPGEEFLCGTVVPAGTNVVACRDLQLAVAIPPGCQAPLAIEWWRNGSVIPGASGERLLLRNVQPGVEDGSYRARLYGLTGTVETAPVSVVVQPDIAGPRIVRASAVYGAEDRWRIEFDEPIDPGGGGVDPLTYEFFSPVDHRTLRGMSVTLDSGGSAVLVVSEEARMPGAFYQYRTIQAIGDQCGANETPHGMTGPVLNSDVVLDYDDFQVWRYSDEGVDHGTLWRFPGFDDSGWKSGRQLFHANRGNLNETEVAGQTVGTFIALTNFSANPPTNLPTVYFRTRLYVPLETQALLAYPLFDDGLLVYVNGVEVHRTNVSSGADQWANYSGGGSIDAGAAGFTGPFEIPLAAVNPGAFNTLAVMLKQVSGTSGDLTFGLRVVGQYGGHVDGLPVTIVRQPAGVDVTQGRLLTLRVEAEGTQMAYQWFRDGVPIAGATAAVYQVIAGPADAGRYRVRVNNPWSVAESDLVSVTVRPVVLPYSQPWRYSTNSQNLTLLGIRWSAAEFDDSTWEEGPGPFGRELTPLTLARLPVPLATLLPAPDATFLTAYFRTTINVPPAPAGSTLVLTHVLDDGAIFYVDGVPALNYNGPLTSPVLSSHLAPGLAPGDGDATAVSVPMALSPGTHSIAVEVHQNAATSSDVVFGAEWRYLAGAPVLTWERTGDAALRLSWTDDRIYSLHEASSLDGPFTPVVGDPRGVYVPLLSSGVDVRFFQLRFNGR